MAKKILRVATAGSVDDGKSTLLARLLLDTNSIPLDQRPKSNDPLELSNLLDGLDFEREQGITIDVAHRFLDIGDYRYHLTDSPGHEQYTRNMATAAAGADVLLLLVSAPEGVKPQTLIHLRVAQMLRVKNVVVVINKLDQVKQKLAAYRSVKSEILSHFDAAAGTVQFVNVVALTGENIVKPSARISFDETKSLLETLTELASKGHAIVEEESDTIVSIQSVIVGNKRLYLGSVISGNLSESQTLTLPGGSFATEIENLHVNGAKSKVAKAGDQVAFNLKQERDLVRGDVMSSIPIHLGTSFEADLVWLDSKPGLLRRRYLLQIGHKRVSCRITKIKQLNVDATDGRTAGELPVNSTSRVEFAISGGIFFKDQAGAPESGRFILIDSDSANTVAAGVLSFELRKSQNVSEHAFAVNPRVHAESLGFQGKVLWLTGLSGSGKSTIANELGLLLQNQGKLFSIIDGDSVRHGLNRDLGFSDADRSENIRRVAEVAKIQVNSGIITIVALVSPYVSDREDAKEIIGPEDFLEVFVDAPIAVCEARDPKGLYKKARAGSIPNFTGVGGGYEAPRSPAITLNTTQETPASAARKLIELLEREQV